MNNTDDLQELALRLSAFSDVLSQHAAQLVRETVDSTQALRETASVFTAQAQQLSRDVVQNVGVQAREVIERNVAVGMQESGKALHRAATHAESVASALQAELLQLAAAQRSLIWKSGLGLLAGALLAVGGSSYLVWKNHRELEKAQFPTEIMEAVRTGALTRCNYDALCVRIADKAERFGEKGQYVEVR